VVSLILAVCLVVIPTPAIPSAETKDQGREATLESLLTQQAATIESLNTLVAPTATPMPVETELIPEPTATPEVTVIPVYTGEFNVIESGGLVFKLPVEVAASAEVTTILPDDPNMGWPEFALLARRAVSFTGYSIQNHFHTPVIYVYPIDKLIEGGLIGATKATELQALLSDLAHDRQTAERLPFLPPFNVR